MAMLLSRSGVLFMKAFSIMAFASVIAVKNLALSSENESGDQGKFLIVAECVPFGAFFIMHAAALLDAMTSERTSVAFLRVGALTLSHLAALITVTALATMGGAALVLRHVGEVGLSFASLDLAVLLWIDSIDFDKPAPASVSLGILMTIADTWNQTRDLPSTDTPDQCSATLAFCPATDAPAIVHFFIEGLFVK